MFYTQTANETRETQRKALLVAIFSRHRWVQSLTGVIRKVCEFTAVILARPYSEGNVICALLWLTLWVIRLSFWMPSCFSFVFAETVCLWEEVKSSEFGRVSNLQWSPFYYRNGFECHPSRGNVLRSLTNVLTELSKLQTFFQWS